jgi:hypothetical protein
MIQNWNHIISYIRNQLGAVNQLELTDDELIDYLKQHTLPEFSIYSPAKLWVLITQPVCLELGEVDKLYNENTYTIETPDDVEIISVDQAYTKTGGGRGISGGDEGELNNYLYQYQDPRDTVMSNTFNTMMDYLNKVQHFQYLPPRTITFGSNVSANGVILELHVYHARLDTIKRDIYMEMFRPMALRDIIDLIMANRSKFQEVASPFGQINLNLEYLREKQQKLEEKIEDWKSWKPPENLVAWIE